ncbi:ADP-ribosylglycohydrolase (plasmid) [Euzebya pacifica]|uniref:ADP-ribosylglycohydrolase n=1 Tax=Euzebya pacifica TaxID=1608957 RepID=A0A346Y6B1_9ACTN|nr:ADP-ribosylglycohydrolase family protein [Euzebya pacifica]AXV10008.1 ADP-ribosylglycohydrolase [Euzebya pacifica]
MSTQRSLFGRITDTVRPSRARARDRRDRIAGALLGVHVGDSLGATHEFASGPNTGEQTRDIVGGGTFRWEAGQPTDDTDLTLAVMRAHLAHPDDDDAMVRDAADRMVAWMESGPRDIGGTTRKTLGAVRNGVPLGQTGATHEHSAANGSLMRCIPTGALIADPARRRVVTDMVGGITHGLPVCRDSCIVYNDVVAALVDGADFEDAVRDAVSDPRIAIEVRDAVFDVLSAGPDGPPPVEYGQKQGWVLGSLRTAVWAGLQPDGEQALIEVANAGGDADTNGAIAGGLIGARDGMSALPERWLDTIWHHDEMVDAAAVFADRREREGRALRRRDRVDRPGRGDRGGVGSAGGPYGADASRRCGAATRAGGRCQQRIANGTCPHHGSIGGPSRGTPRRVAARAAIRDPFVP